MSEVTKAALRGKTEQLLQGRLKHVQAAALAAALVPLAAVPAAAQQFIPGASGGVTLNVTGGCTGYTLSVAGFALGPAGTTGVVTYSISVSPPTPALTTATGSMSITSTSSLGDFGHTVSGSFSQPLTSASSLTVTAQITGFPGSLTTVTFTGLCSAPVANVPFPCDFITSGGFVITNAGAMANFGAHGGCKHDGFWGHINYVDHATGYHVDSTDITGYLTPTDPTSHIRDICGLARTNNPSDPQPVMFRVRLGDFGEPGINDIFGIRLSNGYLVTSRTLNNSMGGGGNVQLHKENPSTTAPSPLPTELQMCGGLLAP